MRKFILYLFCLFIHYTSAAQVFTEVKKNVAFEEFLVNLAWKQHPTNAIFDSKVKIAELGIKEARLGYWDAVLPFISYSNVSLGLVNSIPDNPVSSNNGFSFGLSLRLAPLYATEHQVSIAKEEKKIAQLEQDGSKLQVRTKVLTAYREVLYAEKIVEERLKVESEAKENQRLALELFKKDAAEYEDINTTATAYHKAFEERLRAELAVETARLALEEWIGMPLLEANLLFSQN